MAKTLVLILFFLLFFPLVSAVATIGQNYDITVSCQNFTCSSLNITILYPNSTVLISDAGMTDNGEYANYSFIPSVFGVHKYYLYDGGNYSEGTIIATSTGYELSTSSAIIYLSLFAFLIFLFVITIFGIEKLPSSNTKDEEGKILSISHLKYLRAVLWFFEWMLLIAILFLTSNLAIAYLGEKLFANVLFSLFRVCLALTPIIVIIWFFWIFLQIRRDNNFKKLLERGIFPQGNL